MNISEVSIGDLVLVNERPVYVTLAVLSVWNDNIKPIPITKELLEKNGFEKEGVIELYNLYAGIDHRVTIHDDKEYMNSNNEWYVHVDSEDYSTIAGCELTYVHELQHILRLCKIDKEIVV
jgi:hypothetical protein